MERGVISACGSVGRWGLLTALIVGLAACGGGTGGRARLDLQGSPDLYTGPGPGRYKISKPYEINGIRYYPEEDYSYDETGIASWYGRDFHGLKTSNGEIFNKNGITAAHKTLPLPCLARVTNLENGRSLVVRVNDRGPFAAGRIIDISQRGAELLGFDRQGTAKVRVQVLANESRMIADAMRAGERGPAVHPVTSFASSDSLGASSSAVQSVEAQTLPSLETFAPPPAVQQAVIPPGANQLYVQAGSFTSAENAARLKATLSPVGQVRVAEVVVRGTPYYRVQVGPLRGVAEADAMLGKIAKTGINAPRIVVE